MHHSDSHSHFVHLFVLMTLLTSEGKYLNGSMRNISRKCRFSQYNEHNIFVRLSLDWKPNEEHLRLDTLFTKILRFQLRTKVCLQGCSFVLWPFICWYLILSTFVCAYDVKWISSIYVF